MVVGLIVIRFNVEKVFEDYFLTVRSPATYFRAAFKIEPRQ